MARVTVEDCLKHVDNHFELVDVVSARVEQIKMDDDAADPMMTMDIDENKDTKQQDKLIVRALREVADGKIDRTIVKDREARRKEYDFERITAKINFNPSNNYITEEE